MNTPSIATLRGDKGTILHQAAPRGEWRAVGVGLTSQPLRAVWAGEQVVVAGHKIIARASSADDSWTLDELPRTDVDIWALWAL